MTERKLGQVRPETKIIKDCGFTQARMAARIGVGPSALAMYFAGEFKDSPRGRQITAGLQAELPAEAFAQVMQLRETRLKEICSVPDPLSGREQLRQAAHKRRLVTFVGTLAGQSLAATEAIDLQLAVAGCSVEERRAFANQLGDVMKVVKEIRSELTRRN